jgi:hypothetical protein
MANITKMLKLSTYFLGFAYEEYNHRMMENISKDELIVVLASFKKDRSFGLDEWTIKLFIGIYELVEEDLMRLLEEVQRTGKILENVVLHFLALIPKKDNLESFNVFRPISL